MILTRGAKPEKLPDEFKNVKAFSTTIFTSQGISEIIETTDSKLITYYKSKGFKLS